MDQAQDAQGLEGAEKAPDQYESLLGFEDSKWYLPMDYSSPNAPYWICEPLQSFSDHAIQILRPLEEASDSPMVAASQINSDNGGKVHHSGSLISRAAPTNDGLLPCGSLASLEIHQNRDLTPQMQSHSTECSLRGLRHHPAPILGPTNKSHPHHCDHPACTTRPFSDRGGLLRHQRELHGIQGGSRRPSVHYCPVSTCKRHARGFPRVWNLQGHMERMHGQKGASSSLTQSPPSRLMEEIDLNVEQDGREKAAYVMEDGESFMTNLQARLAGFRKKRAELDGDIRALEATLRIYQASSCGSSGVGVVIRG